MDEAQDYDAIIIGAGLAGLSSGAMLARQGRSVLVLEKHHIPGGCATTFKRKDFVMEVGLHAMDGHLVVDQGRKSMMSRLGIADKVNFLPLPEFYRIKGERLEFSFPSGSEKAREALIRSFPLEKKGIGKFMDMVLGVQDELSRIPRKKWKQVARLPLFPLLYPHTLRAARFTLGQILDRYIGNEDLKIILQGNLIYYHDDPYTMSMAFFAKAQASFIDKGGYYIQGGSQNLSDALASSIRESGGSLLTGKTVSRILTKGKKAVGVAFRDTFNGKLPEVELKAEHIIHSGAIPLVKGLLNDSLKHAFAVKYDKFRPSISMFCVYLGFNGKIQNRETGAYSTIIPSTDMVDLKGVYAANNAAFTSRSFIFVDYGIIDSRLAPEGKSTGVICLSDKISDWTSLSEKDYTERKEEACEVLVGRLEKHFPGIRSRIEYMDCGTPLTIKRYTLNPDGAPYGFAQVPKQAGLNRPGSKSPVKNLWLAGSWTFPGGSFTASIVGGFLAAYRAHNKLGEVDISQKPPVYKDSRKSRIIGCKEIATNTLELSCEKPEGFVFEPGQYAILHLEKARSSERDLHFRTLSIASHPEEKELRFLMRQSGSSFKQSCESVGAEDRVTVYGPKGEFMLDKESDRGIVFLVAGIGISPVIPMIKDLLRQDSSPEVHLFHSNRTRKEAVFHDWFQSLSPGEIHFHPRYSASHGRLQAADLKSELGKPDEMNYYIVGSSAFLLSMKQILAELSVPEASIHVDDFG